MTRSTIQTALLAAVLAAAPAFGAERLLILEPASTAVSFGVEATGHDVEGVVGVESGEVRFDTETGAASGEIVLDATGAATGNGSRDKTMRNEVLEVAKFPKILFTPVQVEGSLPEGGLGRIVLHGLISLHGVKHPLALPTEVTVTGDRIVATAEARIPYLEWGLHDPSIAFLKVARIVSVSIRLQGELKDTTVAARAETTPPAPR